MSERELELLVGRRVQERRAKAHLTQRELADAVGMSVSMVAQIERGERTPSLGTLVSIAEVLGCSVEDLVREER